MAKYKVREQFHVHLDEKVHEPGSVLELTDDQVALVAHQVEPVAIPKASKARGSADVA